MNVFELKKHNCFFTILNNIKFAYHEKVPEFPDRF